MFEQERHLAQLILRLALDFLQFLLHFRLLHLRFCATGDELSRPHRERAGEGFGDPRDNHRGGTAGASCDGAHDPQGHEQPVERAKDELADAVQPLDAILLRKQVLAGVWGCGWRWALSGPSVVCQSLVCHVVWPFLLGDRRPQSALSRLTEGRT